MAINDDYFSLRQKQLNAICQLEDYGDEISFETEKLDFDFEEKDFLFTIDVFRLE